MKLPYHSKVIRKVVFYEWFDKEEEIIDGNYILKLLKLIDEYYEKFPPKV